MESLATYLFLVELWYFCFNLFRFSVVFTGFFRHFFTGALHLPAFLIFQVWLIWLLFHVCVAPTIRTWSDHCQTKDHCVALLLGRVLLDRGRRKRERQRERERERTWKLYKDCSLGSVKTGLTTTTSPCKREKTRGTSLFVRGRLQPFSCR